MLYSGLANQGLGKSTFSGDDECSPDLLTGSPAHHSEREAIA